VGCGVGGGGGGGGAGSGGGEADKINTFVKGVAKMRRKVAVD